VPTPLGYSGQRADDVQPPPRRASDGDAWLVMAAAFPYAVPVETVVRAPALAPAKDTRPPLPFRMFRRVPTAELRAARSHRPARHGNQPPEGT
jgi:hypothetical protein